MAAYLIQEVKHKIDQSKKTACVCLECSKKFRVANFDNVTCPKCGGSDVDVA